MVAENLEDTLMGPAPKEEEDPNVFYDVAMAPFRGAEGALYSAYQLADDYLLNDVLPDWESRALGTSKTIPGMAVEGVAQFVTGWFPFLRATKGLALAGKGAKYLRGLGTAAAADFTAFVGQENRLSNLIQQVPELQNPVTEFLAHDADEGEIEGRLKNVLEGLGLEALGFAFIRGLKAIKDGKAEFGKTGSEDAVRNIVNERLEGGRVLASIKKDPELDRFYYGEKHKYSTVLGLKHERDIIKMDFPVSVFGEDMNIRELEKRLDDAIAKEDFTGGKYSADNLQFYLNNANEKIKKRMDKYVSEEGIDLKEVGLEGADLSTVDLEPKLKELDFKSESSTVFAPSGIPKTPSAFDPGIDPNTEEFLRGDVQPTVSNTLDQLTVNAKNPEVRDLAKNLKEIISDPEDLNVPIKYNPEKEGDGVLGKYRINEDDIELLKGAGEEDLVHEILHGVTARKINESVQDGLLSFKAHRVDEIIKDKNIPQPIRDLTSSFKTALEHPSIDRNLYQFNDLDEFLVGAFTDKNLQELLSKIQVEDNRTLFQKLVDSVFKLIGAKGDQNLLSKVIRDSAQIISGSRESYKGKVKSSRLFKIGLFSKKTPDFKPAKQDEFLNQIPEHFREYVGALLRGQSIDMPQFRTDNDGYVLKEILDKIAENDPEFVASYTKDWKDTDTFKTGDEVVDNAYAGQLLNLDPIEAAKIARQQQAVWRVEGKGLVEKVLKARDEVEDSGYGEIPAAKLKNAFQELVEFADRYRRLGREAALLLGERREKFRGVGRKVGLDEAEVLTDGVRREYLNKNGNWTKKARQLVEILEYVDPDDLDGAIKTVTGIAKKSQGNSWLDMPLEYWMNSILSGSAQIVNAVGASFTGTMHTLETAIGGLFSRNPRIAKEALAGWADLSSMHEGFKLYIQALKNDRTFFNQANKFDLRDPAIIPERFGLRKQQSQQVADWDLEQGLEPMNQTSKAYKAIDILGKVIRLPSRHLTAQDTFFKTMFARRELRLRLALDAMKDADAGVPREVIAERIQKQLSGLIDENGRAFSEETLIREGLAEADAKGLKGNERAKYAMQYKQAQSKSVDTYNKLKAVGMADHLTMMEELKPGIAKSLQNMTNAHPGLKLVLPFIRTPTNILNYAIGRTPFGKQFYKDFKTVWRSTKDNLEGGSLDEAYDDLSKALESQDPLVVARAKGRLAVSSITAGVLVDAYFNNRFNITGGGPSDEKQIAQLKQTGWRPYSIKIGDTYYSYVKLDPYATILGTIADMIEVGIKEEKGFDETGMQHLMSSLIITIQRNIFNKSYMTGLDTLVKVAQQPEMYGDYAIQSFGSSLVPYSSALGRLNEYQGDQISREINSLKEAVLYKIPGQREKLDPKRNILGEAMITENMPLFGVINPIAYSTEKSNAVLTELANLKHAFRQPPSRQEGGLFDMLNFTNTAGQSSYDRWLELTGTIKIGRRTLNQALEKLINSKRYSRLLPFAPETGLDSPRVREVTNIIRKYRSRAFNQMLKESYVDDDGIELSDVHERVNRAKIIASRGASREDVLELLTQ